MLSGSFLGRSQGPACCVRNPEATMVFCLSFRTLTVSLPPNRSTVAGCLSTTAWRRTGRGSAFCNIMWLAPCELVFRCLAVANTIPPGQVGEQLFATGTRRRLLMTTLLLGATNCAQANEVPMMEEPDAPRFRRTPSGVKIQEVLEGTGPQANEGDLVEFNYVLRRANGYFVFSTIDLFGGSSEPVVFPLGKGKIIPGLEEVLLGMKPGGKRRALVPPDVGYTDMTLEPQPQDFGPRRSLLSHIKEPLVFEIQLLKIK